MVRKELTETLQGLALGQKDYLRTISLPLVVGIPRSPENYGGCLSSSVTALPPQHRWSLTSVHHLEFALELGPCRVSIDSFCTI